MSWERVPGGSAAVEREGVAARARAALARPEWVAASARAASGRPEGVAASGRRGLVATALGAAASWLLEPADPASEEDGVVTSTRPRPVIAVFGLARGCGVTVVARALAAELASRDVAGAAAVHSDARAAGIPLATRPAARLAKLLADVPGGDTRAVGRLCLVGEADLAALAETARHLAPVVLDAGSTAVGGAPAALADWVVLVATPAVEPALATVASECLARLGHEPIVVLNRAHPTVQSAGEDADPSADQTSAAHLAPGTDGAAPVHPSSTALSTAATRPATSAEAWASWHVLRLPESRMGAQLAAGGREPRGDLGRAVEELADLCGGRP